MSKKILLVDDAAMFLQIQKDFLKLSTLRLECARDGEEALVMVRALRPDLIVMDLHMPGMNGAECCAAIKADPELRSIPVIMATNSNKPDDHELCRRAGCDELLTKPFDRGTYLDAVRRHVPELDRRESRIPCNAKARFQAFRVSMTGTVLDIGVRGIYLATEYRLDVGTEIVLAFSLSEDGAEMVQAKGIVRWTNPDVQKRKRSYPQGVGVEFTAVTAESQSIVRRYLVRHGA